MVENMNLEKLIIETSILFVSISSVIGLNLGALNQQYRLAYINLGKMLYFSFPFIVASFWAFLTILTGTQFRYKISWSRKLAWSFYLTGFIFIMTLAALASQTEVVPEGFILMMSPIQTVFWEFVVAGIIFLGFSLRLPRKPKIVLAILLLVTLFFFSGILLLISGTQQTVDIERVGIATLASRYSVYSINISLEQAQQIAGKLEGINEEARFDYFLMGDTEFNNANASGDFFSANSLIQDSYITRGNFLKTIQESDRYFLVIKNEYFLGNNVTYSLEVYKTDSRLSFIGLLLVAFGVSGLGSYVSTQGEQAIEDKFVPSLYLKETKKRSKPLLICMI